jgi:hypothetical protein
MGIDSRTSLHRSPQNFVVEDQKSESDSIDTIIGGKTKKRAASAIAEKLRRKAQIKHLMST